MPPEVNAHLIHRLRNTFCAIVKCSCGSTQHHYFLPREALETVCWKCKQRFELQFGELDMKKIRG